MGVPFDREKGDGVIGIVLAVLVAALVYFLCMVLGLPSIVAIIAAILVLLAGIPTGGDGLRAPRGGGGGRPPPPANRRPAGAAPPPAPRPRPGGFNAPPPASPAAPQHA